MKLDQDKVEVIGIILEPTTVKPVRGFIGMIGCFWRFIPAFSWLATLLITLIKKYARCKLTEDCQRHLIVLKKS